MPGCTKAERERAREVFFARYAASGDYREAAETARVSERTGRRWRDEAAQRAVSGPASTDLTSFVGRRRDIAAVTDLLARSRLVTIVGPPGMGKTRLARRVLEELGGGKPSRSGIRMARGPLETAFCDLRHAQTLDDVVTEVCRALGIRLGSSTATPDAVRSFGSALAARGPSLLVLDNVEQMVGVAELSAITTWLEDAPKLRVLATSRSILRIPGEHLYELCPLALPRNDEDLDCASMALFFDRAQTIEPGFSSSEGVAELVRRLEGIPLALELAAGQLVHSTPQEITENLDAQRLDLRSPQPPTDPRHTTLSAAIQGSWDRLPAWAREAWAQLSIFRGGFDFEAVQAVVELSAYAPALTTAEVVQALREASLIHVTEHGAHLRWEMYEAIREFGFARLEASKEVRARSRHAAHFRDVGQRMVKEVPTSRGHEARRRLFVELSNLRAALDFRLGSEGSSGVESFEAIDLALAIAAAASERLPQFTASLLRRVVEWLGTRRSKGRRSNDVCARYSWLCVRCAEVASMVGDYDGAERVLRRARGRRGTNLSAAIDHAYGVIAFFRGDLDEADRRLGRAHTMAASTGDRHLLGRVLRSRGYFAAEGCGDENKALQWLNESSRVLCETGDELEAHKSRMMRLIYRARFSVLESANALRDLVAESERLDEPWSESFGWIGIGWFFHDQNQLAEARQAYEQAHTIAARSGLGNRFASATLMLATICDEEGDSERASALFARAIEVFASHHEDQSAAVGRMLRAGCLARLGEQKRARRVLRDAEQFFSSYPDHPWRRVASMQREVVDCIAGGSDVRGSSHRNEGRGEGARWTGDDETLARNHIAARIVLRRLRAVARQGHEGEVTTVWVASNGDSFQVGAAPKVDLRGKRVMRRIVVALAMKHLNAPGVPLTHQEVQQAGWPGEIILPGAAAARVHMTISRLRRLGLSAVLQTVDDGYRFDPSAMRVEMPGGSRAFVSGG